MKLQFYSDYKIRKATENAQSDWGFEHLGKLKNLVCVDIVKNPSLCRGNEEYGLVFRAKGGTTRTAWIMRDPEGNGSGHLDIVGSDDK